MLSVITSVEQLFRGEDQVSRISLVLRKENNNKVIDS
jgi:hypothetical protein